MYYCPHYRRRSPDRHRGAALLLVIFILALATIIVTELSRSVFFDLKSSRSFIESIQSDYLVKSAANFGLLVLELPKPETIKETWLGDRWALLGASSITLPGLEGTRVAIVDESGKINLNAIVSQTTTAGSAAQHTPGVVSPELFWKNAVGVLFKQGGFTSQTIKHGSKEEYRIKETIGDKFFDDKGQVAVLHDWIDRDKTSHNDASFPGEGIESKADKGFFFNRSLLDLRELILVPGMSFERIRSIAPFVRVASSSGSTTPDNKININTAPFQVLVALGLSESQASEVLQQRTNAPITAEILATVIKLSGDPKLQQYTKVTSNTFSILCRTKTANQTKWLRGSVSLQGQGLVQKAKIVSMEIF